VKLRSDQRVRAWALFVSMSTLASLFNFGPGPSAVIANEPLELKGHGDAVYDVAFSPDGRLLASGSYDKTVKLWSVSDAKVTATLHGHQDQVFRIAFSPDGRSLASCSGDGTTIVWDLDTGEKKFVLVSHRDPMLDVAYSPNGKLVATAGAHIQLWKKDREVWSTPHLESFFSLAFSPDQESIVCGTRDLIQIYSVEDGTPLKRLADTKGMIYQLEYSGDANWLLSVSSDGNLSLWSAETGELARRVRADRSALFSAAFSPDGKHLISGGRERVVRTWSVPELELEQERYGPEETVLTVTYSPDGKQIASGAYDGTIHLWRPEE
jgi:WD40 repeat protein